MAILNCLGCHGIIGIDISVFHCMLYTVHAHLLGRLKVIL